MASPPPSIRDLRERFRDRFPDEKELEGLRGDPRKGVQALVSSLEKRRAREASWSHRVQELSEYRIMLEAKGFRAIAGLDEAGRGPLAGPVSTGCVILPPDWNLPGLNDSKKVSATRREELCQAIEAQARGFSVDFADHHEIDEINILEATLASMRRAVKACGPVSPDYLLLDALGLGGTGLPFRPVVGGDGRVAEIAAASILAKVYRDRYMVKMDAVYPGYGFAEHKGYGTQAHMEALERLGPCPIHRHSFAPVAKWILPTEEELRQRLRRAHNRTKLREVGLQIRRASRDLTESELDSLRELYRNLDHQF
jgi:ribonuclease HII